MITFEVIQIGDSYGFHVACVSNLGKTCLLSWKTIVENMGRWQVNVRMYSESQRNLPRAFVYVTIWILSPCIWAMSGRDFHGERFTVTPYFLSGNQIEFCICVKGVH